MGNYLSYSSLATLAAGDVLGIIDVSDPTHAAGGTTKHVTAANLAAYVLTSPTINDGTNEIMDFVGVGSAVNYLQATSAATGNGPTLSAVGDDVAEIDINLTPKGTGGVNVTSGALSLPAGSTAAPALNFGTANTGIYGTGSAVLFSISGGLKMSLDSGPTLWLRDNAGSFALGSSADARIYRDAAGILAQRNGANAQALRVYNTWTDAFNCEWFEADWKTTANTLLLSTNANGTGVQRDIMLNGANRATKIADPSGGATTDAEARTAINAIIDALESHGLSAAV